MSENCEHGCECLVCEHGLDKAQQIEAEAITKYGWYAHYVTGDETDIRANYHTQGTKEKPVPIPSWTNWATPGAEVVVCRVLYSDGKEYNVDPKIVKKLFELDFSQVSKYGEEWGTLGFDPQQK